MEAKRWVFPLLYPPTTIIQSTFLAISTASFWQMAVAGQIERRIREEGLARQRAAYLEKLRGAAGTSVDEAALATVAEALVRERAAGARRPPPSGGGAAPPALPAPGR